MAKKGCVFSEEHKRKLSEAKKGNSYATGHTLSEESRNQIRDKLIGIPISEECRKNREGKYSGINNPNYGKVMSQDQREKISKKLRGRKLPVEVCLKLKGLRAGEKHHAWKGGISFEPYCVKFNADLRERVRVFFGHVCLLCGKTQRENGERLSVHHVNFDKMTCCNDVKPLFVPLCSSCHTKTNRNREYYEQHFEEVIMTKHKGQCYLPKPEGGD